MRQVSILSQVSPDCLIFEKGISRLHFLSFPQIFLKAGEPTLFGCGGGGTALRTPCPLVKNDV